jgi:type 1 fimbriae regulatory protein FimB/type 1 fimbriae regulatory protein FimE
MARTKTKKTLNRTPPRKPRNQEVRGREYLTLDEVEQLRRAAAKLGRYGRRDAAMILIAFRHGLRVSELVGLRWDQVDLAKRTIFVRRSKGSKSNLQDLARIEVNALKALAKASGGRSTHVFANERGGTLTPRAFYKIFQRAGEAAELALRVHPHMLRHACGFHLINEGHSTRRVQDHLGHRNIAHTEHYTDLAPGRLGKLWDD